MVCDPINGRAAVFEAKRTKVYEELEKACDSALKQIDNRMYASELEATYDTVLCYGISFYKKRCLVKRMHTGDNVKGIS